MKFGMMMHISLLEPISCSNRLQIFYTGSPLQCFSIGITNCSLNGHGHGHMTSLNFGK